MANLSGVKIIDMGRNQSGKEFAVVKGTVNWSSRERQENLSYTVQAFLRERDEGKDVWNALPNGKIIRTDVRGDADEIVGPNDGFIGDETLSPGGKSYQQFTIRGDFDFGRQEDGNEEYYAVVTVVPDIRGDIEVTADFKPINLG